MKHSGQATRISRRWTVLLGTQGLQPCDWGRFQFHSVLSGDLRCSEVTHVSDLEVRKRSADPQPETGRICGTLNFRGTLEGVGDCI